MPPTSLTWLGRREAARQAPCPGLVMPLGTLQGCLHTCRGSSLSTPALANISGAPLAAAWPPCRATFYTTAPLWRLPPQWGGGRRWWEDIPGARHSMLWGPITGCLGTGTEGNGWGGVSVAHRHRQHSAKTGGCSKTATSAYFGMTCRMHAPSLPSF